MPARSLHRMVGGLFGLLLCYLGVTGTITQAIDLTTILTHAPATDPNMAAIRESLDGPGNYAVIGAADYAASTLPAGLDLPDAMTRVMAAAAKPPTPTSWIELRMQDGRPVGQVQMGKAVLRFDALRGARLADPLSGQTSRGPPHSVRDLAKHWHRLWVLGDGMLWINALAGIALGLLTVVGLMLWLLLYRARVRLGRRALFWSAGGMLRSVHRGLALLAAAPLLVIAVSGTILSIDSFMLAVYRIEHPGRLKFGILPIGMFKDYSSPLIAADIPAMAQRTLAAYHADQGHRPIKALRLRTFAGMAQGVVIAGGDTTAQLVYDAHAGQQVTMSEPGYPDTGFPTGWDWHERWKRIHRGDFFGLPGRWLSLLSGLALVWFASSGLWMYLTLWRRRRTAGRPALFWR